MLPVGGDVFAVVGLGNPGRQYEGTRHNIGFEVVQELDSRWGDGRWQTKGGCLYQKARVCDSNCLLLMPQQFMNLSGEAAVPLLRFFKVSPEQTVVVFDELDLEPGILRVRQGGSAAGHRGVKDMLTHMDSANFYRVRVGIGHPRRFQQEGAGNAPSGKDPENQRVSSGCAPDVSGWVLARPGPKEKELLEKAVSEAADAVELLTKGGLKEVQSKFHRKQV